MDLKTIKMEEIVFLRSDLFQTSLLSTMQVFLIGFMGSGKSTLGKLLAQELTYNFVDSDMEIEQNEGIPISKIFEEKGEGYFRVCEKQFVDNLDIQSDTIISCGGGLPCFNDLISYLKKKGQVVYLKLSVESLVSRLKNDTVNRPILAGLNESELIQKIQSQMIQREPIYLEADFIFEMDGLTLKESLEKVKESILHSK